MPLAPLPEEAKHAQATDEEDDKADEDVGFSFPTVVDTGDDDARDRSGAIDRGGCAVFDRGVRWRHDP